jgi:hypothetical protein
MQHTCSEVRWSDHHPLSVVLSGRDTSSTDCCFVELEFTVSGGLGWCLTMTKLTVKRLLRIHSTLLIPLFSFSETQIQEILFYHDGSLSTTFTVDIGTPLQLLTRAMLTSQLFPLLMIYFPPSLMDTRNVS